jgi:hypothetical protein
MVVHLIDACQAAARSPVQRPAARSVTASAPSWRTIWPRRSLRENIAVRRFQSEGGAMSEERRKAAWIGGSVLVKGDVVSHEDLVIDGQVQGTIELGLLIPQHNVLEVVEFEPISEEELRMWRVLRQYEAIASIAPQIVAPDLVDAIAPYRDMNSVSPMVFRL